MSNKKQNPEVKQLSAEQELAKMKASIRELNEYTTKIILEAKSPGSFEDILNRHIESMKVEYLQHANYKVQQQNVQSTGQEILQEVIDSTLKLPREHLVRLYCTPARDKYKKLDFHIAKRVNLTCKVLGRKTATA